VYGDTGGLTEGGLLPLPASDGTGLGGDGDGVEPVVLGDGCEPSAETGNQTKSHQRGVKLSGRTRADRRPKCSHEAATDGSPGGEPGPAHGGKWRGRLRSREKHRRPRTADTQQGEM